MVPRCESFTIYVYLKLMIDPPSSLVGDLALHAPLAHSRVI